MRLTSKSVLAFTVLVLVGGLRLGAAQELTKCIAGQEVTDKEGKTGVIVADDSKLCRVRYPDGQIYSWIYWNLIPSVTSGKSGLTPPGAAAPGGTATSPSSSSGQTLTVLRPTSSRSLVYRADQRGHVTLDAAVNGASVRFVVDTGASLVALTVEDARAAGIGEGDLVFNRTMHTANGPVRVAPVMLREIRIEQFSVDDVLAVVIEKLDQSLLGMSFLKRLKSFEMRDGSLTISW
jgi:aspartyl protease family protein